MIAAAGRPYGKVCRTESGLQARPLFYQCFWRFFDHL